LCPNGDFLHAEFSASCVQHVSYLHPKFALRLRIGEEKIGRKKKPQGKNIMACPIP